MAINWTTAEAVKVLREGKDKAAIMDIGRRFPLFAVAAAGGVEGLLEIINATPTHLTARKIEAVLKGDVEEGAADEAEEAEEKPAKKPAKTEKPARGKKQKPEPEPEDEDEDDEPEEKPAKKGKKAAAEKPAKGKKPASKKAPKVEEEDEDEDWDDEDEDEDGETALEDMSLAELKAEAKKRKVSIKGLKTPKEIVKALKAAEADEDEEDEDDDDDWDL